MSDTADTDARVTSESATRVQIAEAHQEISNYLDDHEQQYPRANQLSVHVNYHDLVTWQSALAFAAAELDVFRPLRAALLRYGRALAALRALPARDYGTGWSSAWYLQARAEEYEARRELDALALALAQEG